MSATEHPRHRRLKWNRPSDRQAVRTAGDQLDDIPPGRDRANEVVAELSDDHAATTVALEFAQGDWRSHQRLLAALPGPVDVLSRFTLVWMRCRVRHPR